MALLNPYFCISEGYVRESWLICRKKASKHDALTFACSLRMEKMTQTKISSQVVVKNGDESHGRI